MALFEIRNLTFTYPDQEKPALTDLNFSLKQGEFLVVCGKSGCGKSTLLRHFKTAMAPYGERKGQILFEGRELDAVSVREQGARIGYVLQSPDNQLVTDKVWHELAFGLENLGYERGRSGSGWQRWQVFSGSRPGLRKMWRSFPADKSSS